MSSSSSSSSKNAGSSLAHDCCCFCRSAAKLYRRLGFVSSSLHWTALYCMSSCEGRQQRLRKRRHLLLAWLLICSGRHPWRLPILCLSPVFSSSSAPLRVLSSWLSLQGIDTPWGVMTVRRKKTERKIQMLHEVNYRKIALLLLFQCMRTSEAEGFWFLSSAV